MKIAVLIPSRERPASFLRAVRSARDTSKADVLAYFDDNDRPYPDTGGAICVTGKPLGSAGAWRFLSEHAMDRGYDVAMTLTDDAIIKTKDWDKWVEEIVSENPIAILSPLTNLAGAHRCDMPGFTRGFMEVFPWFIHPELHHYAWPSVMDALADGICLFKAPHGRFLIHHMQEGGMRSSFASDASTFLLWYGLHKDHHRMSLLGAIMAAGCETRPAFQ